MKMTSEKNQEIQRLHDQINQLLNQQGSQVTEMEEEEVKNIPKIKPERFEIEENKEAPPPAQGMQTSRNVVCLWLAMQNGRHFRAYGDIPKNVQRHFRALKRHSKKLRDI